MILAAEHQQAKVPSAIVRWSVEIGVLTWLLAIVLVRPSPFDKSWALAILAFAPLVIVPLAMRVVPQPAGVDWHSRLWQTARVVQLPAALLFAGALTLQRGWLATLLALPWLATCTLIAGVGLTSLVRRGVRSAQNLGVSAGLIMLIVGAGWAVLDRWGMRPLDFKPVIVLLTAIHFHYAGFVLPILAGLAVHAGTERRAWWVAATVVLSVPAVAGGITATQLQLNPIWETLAAWLMGLAGLLVSWSYWRLAHQSRWPLVTRQLWRLSAAALAAGMVLALLYGSRHFVEMEWLDIPWMRALHGTANAFGFGLAALVGWVLARDSVEREQT